MANWKSKFAELGETLPAIPEMNAIKQRIDIVSELCKPLWKYTYGKILERETLIICKVPATPYQKSKFHENFTFVFQDFITGEKSTFIPYKNRELYGIKDEYRETGGPYPLLVEIPTIINIAERHYRELFSKLHKLQGDLLVPYFESMKQVKREWWDLYSLYLQSEEWMLKRETRIERDNFLCRMCHFDETLHVHHLTYDSVGDEDVENDLITVCKSCHQKLHPYKTL